MTSERAKGVGQPILGSVGVLERLDDSIDTTMKESYRRVQGNK